MNKYKLGKIKQPRQFLQVNSGAILGFSGNILAQFRLGGDFDRRGIWLNNQFDWNIVRDSLGELVLVPSKRLDN